MIHPLKFASGYVGIATFALALCAHAGCGKEEGVKTYPVKGKVIFKGTGKPMTTGNIMFESKGTPKVTAAGEIQQDGSFELGSELGTMGTVAGEHRIMILLPMAEFGEKKGVAKSYASFDTSGVTAKVEPKNNDLTIEIEDK